MLWFRRQPDSPATGGDSEFVAPAQMAVAMDAGIFRSKFAVLLELLGEGGGADPYLEALGAKSRLFQELLDPGPVEGLGRDGIETLLETVMPARKRLGAVFAQMDAHRLVSAVRELLYGPADLEARMQGFVEALPASGDEKSSRKARRAGWDFAAELLHFRAPQRYPLMTRWVWDPSTLSGAVRELLPGGDARNDIPLGGAPGLYEAARVWVAQQMAEQGVYREPQFTVDLLFAHAYADYMRALSSGMGLMNSDFGGRADPMEPVRKLLGIDGPRRGGGSRVKKVTLH
ncbi:MAG: hypothetical protein M0Z84_13430 [Gammaproteobacteria bacterium]|nr:hypothetical protein [Gammaproteobacteria bacterium]